jgi:hypothetical protein
MITPEIITKKGQKAERRAQFTVVCKGVSKKEFNMLCRVLTEELDCKIVLRNPFPGFDAKAIHDIIAHVTGSVIGGYATKKAIDAAQELFIAYVKYKFMSPSQNGASRRVKLYGADDKVLYAFKDKGKKTKKGK